MRNAVINYVYQEAQKNKNIMLLVWDIGYSVIEEFQKNLPDQFINMGISEQNMAGVAAWLALTGKKVFCFSIIPFLIMRAYEQIRVDVCSQNLDVNFIWVGWWFAYWSLGNTHYWIEDINLMKWLPNMKILSPADKYEAKLCMDYLFTQKGPFFVRLNRGWESDIHTNPLDGLDISDGITVQKWEDICLISTWNILGVSLKTAVILESKWISVHILSIPLIKPIDQKRVLKYLESKKGIFTIEEHTVIWWLWDTIASILAENSVSTKFKKFGVSDSFPLYVWNQDYMRQLVWLHEWKLSETILHELS